MGVTCTWWNSAPSHSHHPKSSCPLISWKPCTELLPPNDPRRPRAARIHPVYRDIRDVPLRQLSALAVVKILDPLILPVVARNPVHDLPIRLSVVRETTKDVRSKPRAIAADVVHD